VVVVDPRRHHQYERLVRPKLGRRIDLLHLERLLRLPEALRPDELRVHLGRYLAERRYLTDFVDVFKRDQETPPAVWRCPGRWRAGWGAPPQQLPYHAPSNPDNATRPPPSPALRSCDGAASQPTANS